MDKKDLFVFSQYLLPQHWLSRAAGWLADSQVSWIKTPFISWFAKKYRVDMREAQQESLYAYPSFNAFFTRALKPDARPIDGSEKDIVSPADGAISQLGEIEDGRIFQAKGKDFSLIELLGGDSQRAKPFMGGEFATIYLSPKDYHRVHMPVTGRLKEMVYVPGKLFSVNQATAEGVPELFARNERVVCLFDTEFGPMAMVLVGAMIVASIETTWAGTVTPPMRRLKSWSYDDAALAPITLEKGEEMGRFKLGSTVILCFGQDAIDWEEALEAGSPVKMGEKIAVQDD